LKCGTFADKVKLVIITAAVLNALSLREDIQNVCLTYAYSFDALYYLTLSIAKSIGIDYCNIFSRSYFYWYWQYFLPGIGIQYCNRVHFGVHYFFMQRDVLHE